MSYEPSKEAIEAAARVIAGNVSKAQWDANPEEHGDHLEYAHAALIAAHKAENTAPREFTYDDVNVLFEIMGDAINPNMNTAEIVQRTFDALEAVEAHRAKKG